MLAFITSTAVSAQFSLGINAGIPTGDASDLTTFALGVDVNYSFASETDVTFGLATGYLTYFGDEVTILGNTVDLDNANFIPLAGTFRYSVSDKFSLGADTGYAIGVNDGNDGGFYYRPMLIYSLSEKASLNLSYSGVSDNGNTLSNIGLGISFGL